jgi:hypothetical protein
MPNTATKMVSQTSKIPRKSAKVGKMASLSTSRFSADPPLSLAGGRRSAQAPPPQESWQTGKLNFFSDATHRFICRYGAE